ncbi:hypothetical protein EYF80_031281 [Liparis tanakae]|uniref:Uncharacterized protein n=1 Tax=Liparis tanakae TaxID=230148 RepID=A0A4Z2GXZ8_9TELE|nr:hypothetical protein EYF80_031281 [Liparis tanakae]
MYRWAMLGSASGIFRVGLRPLSCGQDLHVLPVLLHESKSNRFTQRLQMFLQLSPLHLQHYCGRVPIRLHLRSHINVSALSERPGPPPFRMGWEEAPGACTRRPIWIEERVPEVERGAAVSRVRAVVLSVAGALALGPGATGGSNIGPTASFCPRAQGEQNSEVL